MSKTGIKNGHLIVNSHKQDGTVSLSNLSQNANLICVVSDVVWEAPYAHDGYMIKPSFTKCSPANVASHQIFFDTSRGWIARFSTKEYDPMNCYDTNEGCVTIPQDGEYQILLGSHSSVNSHLDSTFLSVNLRKNAPFGENLGCLGSWAQNSYDTNINYHGCFLAYETVYATIAVNTQYTSNSLQAFPGGIISSRIYNKIIQQPWFLAVIKL